MTLLASYSIQILIIILLWINPIFPYRSIFSYIIIIYIFFFYINIIFIRSKSVNNIFNLENSEEVRYLLTGEKKTQEKIPENNNNNTNNSKTDIEILNSQIRKEDSIEIENMEQLQEKSDMIKITNE